MQRRRLISGCFLACVSACGGGGSDPLKPAPQVVVLLDLPPYTAQPFGQESDGGTSAYVMAVALAAGSQVTQVKWWGYHGRDSAGPSKDAFVVRLNGAAVTGKLTVESTVSPITGFTLDLEQPAANVTTISVVNEGTDVEWYWQSASAQDGPHASQVACRLSGTRDA